MLKNHPQNVSFEFPDIIDSTKRDKRYRIIQKGTEKVQKDTERYRKVQKGTEKYKKVQKDTERYTKVHKDTKRYKKIHKGTKRHKK